jgi:hypothetical protein
MPRETCKTCKFWDNSDRPSWASVENEPGYCKFNPPVVISQASTYRNHECNELHIGSSTDTRFPKTFPHDWCGQHKQKELE